MCQLVHCTVLPFNVQVSIAGPVSDVDILQTVRATAGRSRVIQNELKKLKAKLYGLEGDLRGIY